MRHDKIPSCDREIKARREGDPQAAERGDPQPATAARPFNADIVMPERFRAEWTPVRVKKTRQNESLELRF
jgi:hypothetical protein